MTKAVEEAAGMAHVALDEVERLRGEVERLTALVYVPGQWRCAKCKFVCQKMTLNANTGAVGVQADTKTEPCPNGCGPLWPMTERESGNELADRCIEALDRATKAEAAIKEAEAAKDGAYLERNRLVALLAKLFPSGIKRTAIEGWSEDWHGCVFIDLPNGQASWHYHDSQAFLFDGLPPYSGDWDGHTTDEKYARIASLPATALLARLEAAEKNARTPAPERYQDEIDGSGPAWQWLGDIARSAKADLHNARIEDHDQKTASLWINEKLAAYYVLFRDSRNYTVIHRVSFMEPSAAKEARTPGTVEVCAADECERFAHVPVGNGCGKATCPIRTALAGAGKRRET